MKKYKNQDFLYFILNPDHLMNMFHIYKSNIIMSGKEEWFFFSLLYNVNNLLMKPQYVIYGDIYMLWLATFIKREDNFHHLP